MCGDDPPKSTDVIDISHWSQLVKSCFETDHSLYSNTRDDLQTLWIVWIPKKNKAISKRFKVTQEYNNKKIKNEFSSKWLFI